MKCKYCGGKLSDKKSEISVVKGWMKSTKTYRRCITCGKESGLEHEFVDPISLEPANKPEADQEDVLHRNSSDRID
jgi:DNA-directed RNA polymerase subunit RPC12/RpoP